MHHLDSQFKRVFDYLKQEQLLDSTVVIVLGDHGEEFMEKGGWGHNFKLCRRAGSTPFVLWVPGMSPRGLRGNVQSYGRGANRRAFTWRQKSKT